MKLNLKFPVLLGLASIAGPFLANASSSNDETDIETISVYSGFKPVKIADIPQSTSVLDKEIIAKLSGNSALDILKHVPGINIKKSGMVQDIALRGAESNFIVIQIDGVQVNNPLDTRGGSFNLSSLSKNNIERVEIVKGAQSSRYGSDAIAGVINFITFSEQQETKVSLQGSESEQGLHFRTSVSDISASFNAQTIDDSNSGDELQLIEFAAQSSFALVDNGLTSVNMRFSRSEMDAFPDQSGGALLSTNQAKDSLEATSFNLALEHELSIATQHHTKFKFELHNNQEEVLTPGIAPYFNAPPGLSDMSYQYTKLQWLHAYDMENIQFLFGADYKSEDGDNTGYLTMFGNDMPTDFEYSRTNAGAFVDAQFQWSPLTIFGGVRYDNPESADAETTWKLGVQYALTAQLNVYANMSTAFKLPSMYALGNNLIGNPELKPEEAESNEIGAKWLADSMALSFAYFNYDYKNLVDFDGQTFSLVNRSNISTEGYEASFKHDLMESVSYQLHATYTDLEAPAGQILTGRPEWQAGYLVDWRYSDTLSFMLAGNYVDSSTATSLHTGDFSVTQLSSFNTIDLTAAWQMQDNLAVDIFVTNAMDKQYQLAVGVPGQEVSLGIKLNWTLK